MAKNTSFSLGKHFNIFIENQVEQGRYDNASDVMRAALRLLEDQEAKLSVLRAALVEGENSGPATVFDFDRSSSASARPGLPQYKGLPRELVPEAAKKSPHFLVISPRCG